MPRVRDAARPVLSILLTAVAVAALPACGGRSVATDRIKSVQGTTTTTAPPKRLDPTEGLASGSGGADPLAAQNARSGLSSGLGTGSGGKDPTKESTGGGQSPTIPTLPGGTGTLPGLLNALGATLSKQWTATYSLTPMILKEETVTNSPPWQAAASTDMAGGHHWVGVQYSTDINAYLAGTAPVPTLRICAQDPWGGAWRCHDGTVAEVDNPQTALDVAGFVFSPLGLAMFLQAQLGSVPNMTTTTTAETIAGHPSTCVTWADPSGKVPSTQFCLDADGIPTKVTGKIGQFPVTATLISSKPGADAAIARPPA